MEVTNIESLRLADPSVFDALQIILACLRNDMLPDAVQLEIVEAMTPNTRRAVVQQIAGLDASVLMTFKQQIALVDNVLRRIVTPEGMVLESGKDLGISVKDAMNMSLKVVGMLTKDLPKVYNIARVQRLEQALLKVVETLAKVDQDRVLMELERTEMEAARESRS
jgi:septum formation topological specificity factor MinE